MLRTGDRIGDWIVQSTLGEGGMGAVFLCHNHLSERMVAAVKVMKSHDVGGDARERFIREMEALAALTHPNIVRVMGSGEDSTRNVLWMAMEMLDGETLEDMLARGPLDWKEATRIFREIAVGLAHAHERGIRHRDIKPANVMVTAQGAVKILDFGIAVQAGRTRLTNDRTVPGTLPYIPPEIFEGSKPDPALSDIYATGLLLFEMLTGRRAYPENPDLSAGQRMAQIMAAKLAGGVVDPGRSTPNALRQLIAWATQPEPQDRLPQMAVMVAALDAIAAGEIDRLPELKRDDGVMLQAPMPGQAGSTTKRQLMAPETMNLDLASQEDDADHDEPLYTEDYQPGGMGPAPIAAAVVLTLGVLGGAAVLFAGGESPPPEPAVDTEPPEPEPEIPQTGAGSALLPFGYEMVEIPRGDFFMGTTADEPYARRDEVRHPVDITRPFLIGKTEVTQELWTAFAGSNPVDDGVFDDRGTACSKWGGVGDRYPVGCITWEEAALFTNFVSRLEGLEPAYSKGDDGVVVWNRQANGYRLPTEAEWEYAARAGARDAYAGTSSDDEVCTYGNVANPDTKKRHYAWLTWKAFDCDDGEERLAPVAQFQPNGFGLHDMTGNVSEWVWDWYGDYDSQMVDDPAGPPTGEERARRGGNWASGAKESRVANRDHAAPDDRRPLVGLRLARNAR